MWTLGPAKTRCLAGIECRDCQLVKIPHCCSLSRHRRKTCQIYGCIQDMTYVKQLKEYEDAVMKKRLEELNDTEVNRLLDEVETERKEKK